MDQSLSPEQEVAVRRFGAEGSEVAVFEFEGRLRDVIVSNLRDGFLATGTYTPDARALAPQSMQSLAFAGGGVVATAVSAGFSSSLFMATANPATLMQLSSGGVGAAVMGANGIVAQAGFIPVAASLPVVAPIIAMQAIQTAIILQQFAKIDRKLDDIKSTLDAALARSEATHAGELVAASDMVDEVYRQYELTGSFSPDMLIRLALAERDLRALSQRFRLLLDGQTIASIEDLAGASRADYDAYSAILSSFLELRVTYLRVCVDMQENPKAATATVERLKKKIADGIEFWDEVLQRSGTLRGEIDELEGKFKALNPIDRTIGAGAALDRRIKMLKAALTGTLQSELAIVKGFDALIRTATETLKELEDARPSSNAAPTLVYWKDEAGEHSFSTHQLSVGATGR